MKRALINGWNSFTRLFRFLFWYMIAVAAVFYILPMAGLFLESQYETLGSAAKILSVIGLFSVVAGWQVISMRDRRRAPLQGGQGGAAGPKPGTYPD
jgi:drug/metabolite transporter (DMT)-like permease